MDILIGWILILVYYGAYIAGTLFLFVLIGTVAAKIWEKLFS